MKVEVGLAASEPEEVDEHSYNTLAQMFQFDVAEGMDREAFAEFIRADLMLHKVHAKVRPRPPIQLVRTARECVVGCLAGLPMRNSKSTSALRGNPQVFGVHETYAEVEDMRDGKYRAALVPSIAGSQSVHVLLSGQVCAQAHTRTHTRTRARAHTRVRVYSTCSARPASLTCSQRRIMNG